MAVDMALVKKLREQTGIGILECKKAMEEAGNDFTKAGEILRKKGFEKAKKKSSRATNQGVITIKTNDTKGVILEINCETDFVAKNDDFQALSDDVAEHILAKSSSDVETLLSEKFYKNDEMTVENVVSENIHKIGENIVVKRFTVFDICENTAVGAYIHSNKLIGTVVLMKTEKTENSASDTIANCAKELAMQVTAMVPQYVNEDKVPEEVIAKEKEIYKEQMQKSGKPENIIDKIIEGKIHKFYAEICLVHQKYFKNDKLSIAEFVAQEGKKVSDNPVIEDFIRFQVGEEA